MQLGPVIKTGKIVVNSALDSMTPAPSRARKIALGRCARCVARMLCGVLTEAEFVRVLFRSPIRTLCEHLGLLR